jgi:hypothetical protein
MVWGDDSVLGRTGEVQCGSAGQQRRYGVTTFGLGPAGWNGLVRRLATEREEGQGEARPCHVSVR